MLALQIPYNENGTSLLLYLKYVERKRIQEQGLGVRDISGVTTHCHLWKQSTDYYFIYETEWTNSRPNQVSQEKKIVLKQTYG